jgi:hypothetical protein
MPEDKVKKYFSLIEAWVYCDICKDMVNLIVDKNEIKNGLQTGIYTKGHPHHNPKPDLDDPDDRSGEEHNIHIYINDNYEITGSKSFFGEAPSTESFGGTGARIPVVVKEIPEMSVHLGMLTPEEFKVLKICDGNNSLEQVAVIAEKSVEDIEKMMEKLRDKGLVKVIIRA